MKRIGLTTFLLFSVLVVARLTPSHAGSGDLILVDAPRGAWLATVRAGASLEVIEERDGWRRVRVVGWMPSADPATNPPGVEPREATPSGAPAEPKPETAGRVGVIRGVLLPLTGAPAESAGAGLIVMLLTDIETLDREHARAGQECRARVDEADGQLEALRAELRRALNATDNFRLATEKSDRLKSQIASAERERGDRIKGCRLAAQALFERHAARKAVSDAHGAFEFDGISSGHYRVFASEAGGEAGRSWLLECRIKGGETEVLDPRSDRSTVDPFWGVH